MADDLEAVVRTEGDACVLAFAGEIDLNSAGRVQAALERLAAERDVKVDLRQVTFLDARGVAALIYGLHRARATGHRLTVTAASRVVWRVLRLTDTAHVLMDEPQEATALLA
jgi:anti-anti-sigma factor